MTASISHLLTAPTKFSCCSSNRKSLLGYLSLALALPLFFSLSFATCRLLSLFSVLLFPYMPNMRTWQDAGGYAISSQNNLELHLGCHTCSLSCFTLVYLWCGRTDGRTVTWLPKFLEWVDYHIFLGLGLRSRVELRYSVLKWWRHKN